MPLVAHSTYRAPLYLPGGDVQTIFPSLCRPRPFVPLRRERLELPDGDFLDLDWCAENTGKRPLVIVSHGLEGHSRRRYVLGMLRAALDAGFDGLARNFRGCSEEMNRLPQLYHSGETDDLHAVVLHAAKSYDDIRLVGFSMGGNQTLKYLGEAPDRLPEAVRGGAGVSVPCHLESSAKRLNLPRNGVYLNYFLRSLRRKVVQKHDRYPKSFATAGLASVRTFDDFDNRYTAPVHGFRDAKDYYRRAACLPHLGGIRVPTLLLNAANDPFLTPQCLPMELAARSEHLYLEIPDEGGHVGFPTPGRANRYWSERRVMDFFRS